MTPVELAASVYAHEPCARTFREDLEAHLLNGWVFSTPEFFVMGRLVHKDAHPLEIVNPWHMFPADQCNAWLVYLAAGDLSKMWPVMPAVKKWVGWERGNVLRWWRFESLEKRFTSAAPCSIVSPPMTARISSAALSPQPVT